MDSTEEEEEVYNQYDFSDHEEYAFGKKYYEGQYYGSMIYYYTFPAKDEKDARRALRVFLNDMMDCESDIVYYCMKQHVEDKHIRVNAIFEGDRSDMHCYFFSWEYPEEAYSYSEHVNSPGRCGWHKGLWVTKKGRPLEDPRITE